MLWRWDRNGGAAQVSARLEIEQRRVDTTVCQQIGVRPRFDDGPGMQDDDFFSKPYGGEAMRDEQRDPISAVFAKPIDHRRFGERIERCGGLVENLHRRGPEVQTPEREPLPLTA